MTRFGAALLVLATCPMGGTANRNGGGFLPDQWPKQELDRYLALENDWFRQQPAAAASKGMIAGTSGPVAVHAGLQVLRNGGSAADAALTTALAQIALSAGGVISYAGIMTAVYYDAASGKVYTLNAAYNTVQGERNPLSIPGPGRPSGRTALVPGFMAGVQALHDRFGRLPFAKLFGPAIWIAREGVAVSPPVGEWLVSQKAVITRLPDTRRIFTKKNGELYRTGDRLRQPVLAATLRKVAKHGSAYMYTGDWARHMVAAVQSEGGRMTLDDLAGYHASWAEPLEISYRGYRVVSLPPPSIGGLITLGSLKLAETANVKRYGHYTRSADALYYLIQMVRTEKLFATMPAQWLHNYYPGVDPSPRARLNGDTAGRIWDYIRKDMKPAPPPHGTRIPQHSTGVLAVDEQGNVAAILHSANDTMWGTTGIFVDGVSIPDSASIRAQEVAAVGPGARLPDASVPLLVLRAGKPVLASTAMGFALCEVTLQNLINVLDFGMDPKTAVDQPNFRGAAADYRNEVIGKGDFAPAVLDGLRARGQAVLLVPRNDQLGYWIGIQIDPQTRRLSGGVTSAMNALVEGY